MNYEEDYRFKLKRWENGDTDKENKATERLLSAIFDEDVKIKIDKEEE